MGRKVIKTAWIVEDDPVYNVFLDHQLKINGYVTISYSNGEACLQQLGQLPDLILLDHNLGKGINGLETLHKIRAKNRAVPIIYISANNDIGSAVEALKLGVFDYIEKNDSAVIRLKNNIEKIESIGLLLKRQYQIQLKILVLTALICFALVFSMFIYAMDN